MIFLQEGIASGPYLLFFGLLILAGIGFAIYIVMRLTGINKRTKITGGTGDNISNRTMNEQPEAKPAGPGTNMVLVSILIAIVLGLICLLKWGCSITYG